MRDTDAFQDFLDTFSTLAGGDLLVEQWQHHIFRHCQFVDQVKALEDKADIFLANVSEPVFRIAGDVLACEFVAAGVRRVEHAEHIEQRRLAATGRPHDGDELTGIDFEVDHVERRRFDVRRSVGLDEIVHFDHCFHS